MWDISGDAFDPIDKLKYLKLLASHWINQS